jgi:hypothetical protein
MLNRMKGYKPFTDMEEEFGLECTQLSRIFDFMVEYVVARNSHLVMNNVAYFQPKFQEYNMAIRNHVLRYPLFQQLNVPLFACLDDVALFTDGTRWRISRPGGPYWRQAVVFNGKDRVHCLEFQSTVAPDGMIVDCFGPCPGPTHDVNMWRQSCINSRLAACQLGQRIQYKTYGDKAYINDTHTYGMRLGRNAENRIMSNVRMCVEWSFGDMERHSAYISHYHGHKIGLGAISKVFILAAILENANTCLYGSNACKVFDIVPPTIGSYFNCPQFDVHYFS